MSEQLAKQRAYIQQAKATAKAIVEKIADLDEEDFSVQLQLETAKQIAWLIYVNGDGGLLNRIANLEKLDNEGGPGRGNQP